MDLSSWYICSVCEKSDDYIDDCFPEDHWAYRCFKTQDRSENHQHNKLKEHLDHFKHLKCEPCNIQYLTKYEYEVHCRSPHHKRKTKQDCVCTLCDFTTPYQSKYDYHCKSQKHIDRMNGIEKETLFRCDLCDYETPVKQRYEQHCAGKKHQDKIDGTQKQTISYRCELCDYETCIKQRYEQHCFTKKHRTEKNKNNNKKEEISPTLDCNVAF